jgi:hypothetical protein
LFVAVESTTDLHARELHASFVSATSGQLRAPLDGLDTADDVAMVLGSVLATSLRAWALGQVPIATVRTHVAAAIALLFDKGKGERMVG